MMKKIDAKHISKCGSKVWLILKVKFSYINDKFIIL